MSNTAETIKALAQQHMRCLCAVLAPDEKTRSELAASLDLIYELGVTAGAIEQAHRSLKRLANTETN